MCVVTRTLPPRSLHRNTLSSQLFIRHFFTFGRTHDSSMSYKERRLLGYSQIQMYDIAADVGQYADFVPWVTESKVLRKTNSGAMVVRLSVGFPPLHESYTSTVTLEKPGSVIVKFEFKSPIYAKVTGLFFDQLVTTMVNSFLDRAKVLHGPSSIAPQKPEVLLYKK
ncbi:unnamed protein product [Dicrocoelium dendriticum]|nr:unnamed protein product [Dicrocoelium dendriticum]